jgi:3-oxoacyl-[acyl-carrier protein] reductase
MDSMNERSGTTVGTRLSGAVALVTGASRGIGAAAAAGLAREGATVAVNCLPGDPTELAAHRVVQDIVDAGGRAFVVVGDVSVESDVTRMVREVEHLAGSPDVLINNAAVSVLRPWRAIPREEWDRCLAVNVTGAFLCSKAVYGGMARQSRGSIINVSSVVADGGAEDLLDYVTSKAALIGLTRALAREGGPDGVRVNAVMPGVIRHSEDPDARPDRITAGFIARQALAVKGDTSDVVAAFIYLASTESRFVTGQTIAVDGGIVNR